mmetsp:Transcript_45439/g.89369  ORF Transcript_45439/g.89369 Transcript_45439/m.89369 type:complete len:202 (-) Transcript_45439:145-750(-)
MGCCALLRHIMARSVSDKLGICSHHFHLGNDHALPDAYSRCVKDPKTSRIYLGIVADHHHWRGLHSFGITARLYQDSRFLGLYGNCWLFRFHGFAILYLWLSYHQQGDQVKFKPRETKGNNCVCDASVWGSNRLVADHGQRQCCHANHICSVSRRLHSADVLPVCFFLANGSQAAEGSHHCQQKKSSWIRFSRNEKNSFER